MTPADGCLFCANLLNHDVKITNNKFEDNQDGFVFWKQQTFERASQIFIRGTHDVLIKENTFIHMKSLLQALAPRKLPFFAHWLP